MERDLGNIWDLAGADLTAHRLVEATFAMRPNAFSHVDLHVYVAPTVPDGQVWFVSEDGITLGKIINIGGDPMAKRDKDMPLEDIIRQRRIAVFQAAKDWNAKQLLFLHAIQHCVDHPDREGFLVYDPACVDETTNGRALMDDANAANDRLQRLLGITKDDLHTISSLES